MERTDKERFDWLEEQIVDEIWFNDGTMIFVRDSARKAIDDIISNAEERAYDRQQESLMEGGGGPSLLEQQQAAVKIKHGFR